MSKAKTVRAPAVRPSNGSRGPTVTPTTVDDAIQHAQKGRVSVTPERAVDMAGTLYSQGKFAQAIKVCRQIIEARPQDADARNILGVSLHAAGKTDEGIAMLRSAIALQPAAANIYANLGEILRQSGETEEAASVLETAVELNPGNAEAQNNLGITFFERSMPKKAIECYQRAIDAKPHMAEAHNNLGNALRMMRDSEGAIHAYQEALVHREHYPEAYNNLAMMLQQRGELEDAERALRRAIAQSPQYVEAYDNLASVHVAKKNDGEALRVLGEALKFAPKHVPTLILTARIQLRRGAHKQAEGAMRHALKEEPDNAEALTVLGQALHELDQYQEAIEVLARALEAQPENPEALNFYGIALKSVGRLDEAREYLLKGLRLNPRMYGAYANLNDLTNFAEGEGAELFTRMDEILKGAKDPNSEQFLALHFAYGKGLDDRGEHERALEHYITGGKLKRAQLNFDEAEAHGFFDHIREAFPRELFESHKFAGIDDDRPTFIIGMPRSGSTLVEQILASHPDVYGAGEVKYLSMVLARLRDRFPSLPKYPDMMKKITPGQMDIAATGYLQMVTANSGDAKRVTDKLLSNHFFVGLLHLMFPRAKFIHTSRDPVDTCLSGFTKLFKDDMPHSYDLGELGRYYRKYRELIEHWEAVLPPGVMMTVQYEDVVAETEVQAKRLIEFLGLPWDDKCLDFHKSERPVKTASVAQVRKPIYKTAVKRWKKYGEGLQPLVDAIEGKPEAAPADAVLKEDA